MARKFSALHAIVTSLQLACPYIAVNAFADLSAFAGTHLASAYRTTPFTSASHFPVAVALTNDGATSLVFVTTAKALVKITYNAECVVTAPRGTWLGLRIMVDGIEANPASGTDFAFCSSLDAEGKTWAAAVRQSVVKVGPGRHEVTIIGRPAPQPAQTWTGSWRLDDSSLVVEGAPLAAATRSLAFARLGAGSFGLPLKENGAKRLKFTTTTDNQRVLVTYNAECDIAAPSQSTDLLSVIDVEGAVSPDSLAKVLCMPVDTQAKTWRGSAHQKVFRVPAKGEHTVTVSASATSGTQSWRVDDSSLVVDTSNLASAWRSAGFQSTSTSEVAVPLKDNGVKSLKFTTTTANQRVIITHSSDCVINGPRGRWLSVRVLVDRIEADPASGHDFALCSAVKPGYITAGFRQSTIVVPTPGEHEVRLYGRASGAASWALYRQWLVVR
jgi:hypothetical protein